MSERRLVPLPRQILTDTVYEAVKELVMDQHIQPGARVNIDQLARQLSVSPTPVREALARLEMDGLIIKAPLKGYSIAPILDSPAFEELYEVRLLLEPFAARRAAERGNRQLSLLLRREIEGMRTTLDHGGTDRPLGYRDYHEFAWQDARFHDAIAAGAGNELLRDTLSRLRWHMHLYRLYYTIGIGIETVAEHEKVREAIAQRQPDEAAASMLEHLLHSRDRLAAGVRQRSGSADIELRASELDPTRR